MADYTIRHKPECLYAAVEIAKEYARGANGQVDPANIVTVLDETYKKLITFLEGTKKP